jgi:hypothetical protein
LAARSGSSSVSKQLLVLHAPRDGFELVRRDLKSCRIVQRQRGLAEDRRRHRGFEHHRQREIAGKAHADGADPRPAALGVRDPRQSHQPACDRARGAAAAERAKLRAHAGAPEDRHPAFRRRDRSILTE